MQVTTAFRLVLILIGFCQVPGPALAQVKQPLSDWKPDPQSVAQLGEVYEDAQISIRPPRDLKKVDRPNPPELAEQGIYSHGWTATGDPERASARNLSVTLTPFSQPSADALDKTIEGMKKSIQAGLEQVRFGKVERGRFGGVDARSGTFTGILLGEKVIAYYLVGIDNSGTFGVTAMLPYSEKTPEATRAMQTSILTFRRGQPARSAGPSAAP
jgi:hypothetical protein